MARLININNVYKIKNPTEDNLKSLGFRYSEQMEAFVYYFTVDKYNNTITLRGCITVTEGIGRVKIDVYRDGGGYYSPFYGIEYGKYDSFLEKIDKVILKEFSKLGIRKVKK